MLQQNVDESGQIGIYERGAVQQIGKMFLQIGVNERFLFQFKLGQIEQRGTSAGK
jgi:hypothetical protein